MPSVVTRAQSSRYRNSPYNRLSFEALLSIFSNLESHDIVVMRRCCKRWQEIIDNNKSLWRVLEWDQQNIESPIQALEMFDEKSASSLKEVSIFQGKGVLDNMPLIKVLHRSKDSLTSLSFKVLKTAIARNEVLELASNSPFLKSLILWPSRALCLSKIPKCRLTRICRQSLPGIERSNNLQVVWCDNLVKDWVGKLDVSPLVSFADPTYQDPLLLRSFISNFSQRVIHLSISCFGYFTYPPSLSCPRLSVLEGSFPVNFPSWLDAPNLRVVIAYYFTETILKSLPVSVEEVWLLQFYGTPFQDDIFHNLFQICPNLKILKIGQELLARERRRVSLNSILIIRNGAVERGGEIKGIKMKSLEKLVIQTDLFKPAQLDELRSLVGAVIDIDDYPDFIELEY